MTVSTYKTDGAPLGETEELLRLLMLAPTPLAVLRGPDHTIQFVNDAYLNLVRRGSADELVGRTMRESRPELIGQGFLETLDDVYRTGVPYSGKEVPVEVGELSPKGATNVERVFYDLSYQPIVGAEGKPTGVMIQANDVTEYVEARQRARAREDGLAQEWEQLAEMYRTAPVGFAMYEPKEFRMIHVNDKFTEMLNMPADAMMGRSVLEFAGEISGVRQRFETVARGGRVENVVIEGMLDSQPGVFRSWLVNYTPIFGPDGVVRAISTVSLDITGQKRAGAALLKTEKLAAVGRLASSIAHEINNPLESVTNLLYLARQVATDQEQAAWLATADRELRRVANIANQTLRFHKQASGPTKIGGADLLSTVLSIYEGRLRNSHIRVEPTMKTGLEVVCYEGEIRQVLNNLVGNAIDAMPHGGRLLLRSRAGTDWKTGRRALILTIADTGGGMSRETAARVFEAFYTTKGIGGTGLGLWVSREIMDRHEGRLLLRSSELADHSGTIFQVILPEDRRVTLE